MAIQQVRKATRRQALLPAQQAKGPSDFDKFLRVAQGVGGVAAAAGNPLGAGIAAGAGLISALKPQQQQPRQVRQQQQRQPSQPVQTVDTGPAISRRLDLANSGTDPVADLLQAQQALQQLPEEQRRQFEKPIGLAIAEQQRRFT